jgi:class 3 adenylate cyclase/tetratricopeptide (TPR) repeat protein
MKCGRCQHANPADAAFCDECGAPLEAACPRCGEANRAGAKFCRKCGEGLTQLAAASPASRSKFASPEAYTPKHLAEKILTSKAALEGERKQVTVLFADLKGSMELLADRDPEEARRLLDAVLERMMEAVHRYEGTVNQVMGDGIMALFGAPVAHEDHAVRACYAALRMQESVRRYGEELRRAQGALVQIRVGLNSGEVVVRSIGSDLRMDYTAVGQSTHLAARMEQLAMPGSCVLSPDTLRLVEGYVDVRSLGPLNVKGLPSPLEVFELTGVSAARTRLQTATVRGLTRFVGRDAEMEQLGRALARAGDGHGQVAALVGEPGVGKSRLTYELTHSHRAHGWLVLEGGSVSYGRATSYFPVIDLLRAYFKVAERDDHREIRERVIGKLLTLDRALEPTLPAFLSLLGAPVEDAAWDTPDPTLRRRRTLEAVKRLLLRESQVQPLLLVFEDLHWVDTETQALLDGLVDGVPAARVLLLVNYRPEYGHAWGSRTYYTQIRLDTLPAANTDELLRALLGDDTSLGPVKRMLAERAGGNPLFLEESVRALVDAGALGGTRGAYRLAQPVETIRVPATVHAIIAARVDRLAPEDKHLLQAASVVGKDVPLPLLQALADLGEADLARGLENLQAAELLYEVSLFPDVEYTFKHALIHEVAYGGVLQERRRLLHGRVVEAIEHAHPERLDAYAEQLGHHALRAEHWEPAARYFHRAGRKAAAQSANREAARLFEEALAALERLPETPQVLSAMLDVRIDLGPTLMAVKGYGVPEVDESYAAARRLCERLGDTSRLFPVLWAQWSRNIYTGDIPAARAVGEQLLGLAQEHGDEALVLEAHHCLGPTLFSDGQPAGALEHAVAGLAIYDPARHHAQSFVFAGHDPGVCARSYEAISLWHLGSPDRALESADRSVALARDLRHPTSLAIALLFRSWIRWQRGEHEAAREEAATLVELGSTHGLTSWVGEGSVLHAAATLDPLQPATLDEMERLLSVSSIPLAWRRVQYTCALADACVRAGRLERAQALLGPLAEEGISALDIGRIRGTLLAALGKPEEAETALRRSVTAARERGARSLELRAAVALARLLADGHRAGEGRRILGEVYAEFTEGFATRDLREARVLLAAAGA